MATVSLTYSGHTNVLNAHAYVFEETTTGTSRSIRLKVTVNSVDYSGERDGYYSVTCSNTSTNTGSVSCVISGSEFTIFDKTFNVSLNSDNKTANIDFSFEAKIYSSSAGAYRTITGSITKVTLTEYIPKYTLSISAGNGSLITVRRSMSDYASTGTLNDGAAIYEGDVLVITFGEYTGYTLTQWTINGSQLGFGVTYTVSDSVSVVATAALNSYTLSATAGIGSYVIVKRTSSKMSGASMGVLNNGATIYHFDTLEITFGAETGYEIKNTSVTGSDLSNGVYTVVDNTSVVVTTGLMGLVYIDNGSTLQACLVYIDNGSSWDMCIPYLDNGTNWDLCS